MIGPYKSFQWYGLEINKLISLIPLLDERFDRFK
jgi:hypothetical protein